MALAVMKELEPKLARGGHADVRRANDFDHQQRGEGSEERDEGGTHSGPTIFGQLRCSFGQLYRLAVQVARLLEGVFLLCIG